MKTILNRKQAVILATVAARLEGAFPLDVWQETKPFASMFLFTTFHRLFRLEKLGFLTKVSEPSRPGHTRWKYHITPEGADALSVYALDRGLKMPLPPALQPTTYDSRTLRHQ